VTQRRRAASSRGSRTNPGPASVPASGFPDGDDPFTPRAFSWSPAAAPLRGGAVTSAAESSMSLDVRMMVPPGWRFEILEPQSFRKFPERQLSGTHCRRGADPIRQM